MLPNNLVIFLLEIAVMLSTALLCGQLARKLRFPSVLGELVGGIILGPTIFGWLFPGSFGWLFPASGAVFDGRDALVQISMLFFLFAVGLELNLGMIRKRGSSIAWTSLLGIVVPFALGFGLVLAFPGLLGEQVQGRLWLFAMFMGTALSISALPVIARILLDFGMIKTEVGAVILGSATVNDLIGWSLFAFILSSFAPERLSGLPPHVTLALVLLFFAFMLTIGRAGGKKVQVWLRSHLPWPGGFLGVVIVLILLAAAFAEAIGIHAIFGAFLVGVAFSNGSADRNEAHEMVYQFAMYFFAPLYFVSIGLKTNFLAAFDPVLVGVVLILACTGKILGASIGAKIGGLSLRQATIIGFALNARGAMEMLLATVALEAGLIDDRLFVALIIMALVTSILSGPVIGWMTGLASSKPDVAVQESYRGMALYEDFREED